MKHITTIMKGNMRKNKGVYISVFILMFLVSVTFFSVSTFYVNSNNRDKEVMEENGMGDILAALRNYQTLENVGVSADSIISDLKSSEYVKDVKSSKVVYTIMRDLNGHSSGSSVFLLSQEDENLHYSQYNQDYQKIENNLKPGEISVPTSYIGMYDCKIGDKLILGIDDNNKVFTVASFLEDPYMGSALMGIKTLVISREDFDALYEVGQAYSFGEDNMVFEASQLLSIEKVDNCKLKTLEFERELNNKSGYASFCWITLSKEQAGSYMMMLTNIFSAILIVFVVVFLVATFIVLSHNISSSIEQDYVNYGILKAVGMTNKDLRLTLIMGYLMAAGLGLLVGIPVSIPVIDVICEQTMPSSGLFVSNTLHPVFCMISVVCMLVFIALFVSIKTIKLGKITPLRAINQGKDSVHFSSILKLPISKKVLNASLAYRQFISGKKQYISAIIVTAILTACIIMINDTFKWANNKDTMTNMFSVSQSDMIGSYLDDEIELYADAVIGKHTEYEKYKIASNYMLFDDILVYCYIIDKPEYLSTVREGRTCLYDNEIVITNYMADGFGIDIGDEVEIKKDGRANTFIVSGIYESANDVGKNFAMSFGGFQKFFDEGDPRCKLGNANYILKDKSVIEDIKNEIGEKYILNTDCSIMDVEKDIDTSQMEIVVLAINGITVLFYVLGAIFVVITVSIVSGKIIAKEKRDYGIFKAIGFTSKKIRMQLAIRFMVVAVFGAFLGIVLDVLFSKYLFGIIFKSFGIYSFSASFSMVSFIIPIILMMIIFAFSAYVKARKVKKVDARILIVE